MRIVMERNGTTLLEHAVANTVILIKYRDMPVNNRLIRKLTATPSCN